MPEKIYISSTGEFCDTHGNIIQLRGVNLDPSVKIPSSPFQATHLPINNEFSTSFYNPTKPLSFINHPLPLNNVEDHINRIKSLGYNTIRLPIPWEAIEHEGPGIYDYKYMDYIIDLLKIINNLGGIYVYIDPHQDVWSRFCGGSGAPLWTLYCAGLNPKHFKSTEAAILHNHYIDSRDGKERNDKKYPKMLWPSNYTKLACQTMFTLFFAGKTLAPKCIINGMNIQDYLQGKFVDAFMELYDRISLKGDELLANNCIIGFESINEPNPGFIGEKNLNIIPKDRYFKMGSTPTGFQSLILGEGMATIVDVYNLTLLGPQKKGTKKIDPKGVKAWLSQIDRTLIDKKFNWVRGAEWVPSRCIWRIHKVWDILPNGMPILLKPNYFSNATMENNNTIEMDETYFINNQFLEYYRLFHSEMRKRNKELLLFLQPPVLKQPPKIINSDLVDSRTVYACHFYDGMSLMFKTWNRRYNADTFGIMRHKYMSPILALVFGESNIRKSIRRQLKEMKDESKKFLGPSVPVFLTEIGMPFDMDNRKAYKDGCYTTQTAALDALQFALEGNNLSYSIWCYCHQNSHDWGDNWNNEDFSIWSNDDLHRGCVKATSEYHQTHFTNECIMIPISPGTGDIHQCLQDAKELKFDYNGFRAIDAILRPYPLKINGEFVDAEFNFDNKTYVLKIIGSDKKITSKPSKIFLPHYHFPLRDVTIHSSSGKFSFDPKHQILKWYHDQGQQKLEISMDKSKFNNNEETKISTSIRNDNIVGCTIT
ncbi:hypothetical protein Kpol_322p5 [Vanderwaltozyma polyspora DSM 70294]|uniref:Glycoside hydrolase family 5 domain-containing protein n=1 Tax=Vanderwaltozyma polyspora (strain ATCC 22028 / DSM 70294 / BCRC 21397 / CBS 2163 / NBRC 10782 / NRRL Y-8283 / UCD 57-17) TaxID=436907 RepID=A7TSX9_VANPO|nr:uncharacterized protein Kpol_322p5 [Vanderwaltozyma polyspora DSM 70294]EDO14628.1 hypothetical protein Kpol_322p5 [Vanderwaltozyma polyspora DSM 70294]